MCVESTRRHESNRSEGVIEQQRREIKQPDTSTPNRYNTEANKVPTHQVPAAPAR